MHHGHNLYVADGSLLPRAVGANPFETIAALAEKFHAALQRHQQVMLNEVQPAVGLSAA